MAFIFTEKVVASIALIKGVYIISAQQLRQQMRYFSKRCLRGIFPAVSANGCFRLQPTVYKGGAVQQTVLFPKTHHGLMAIAQNATDIKECDN